MFLLYYGLWILLNGRITPEILIFGAGIAGAAALLTARLRGRTAFPAQLPPPPPPPLLR